MTTASATGGTINAELDFELEKMDTCPLVEQKPLKSMLVVYFNNGRIGGAFVKEDDCSIIHLVEEIVEDGQFEIMDILRLHVNPHKIAVNGQSPVALIESAFGANYGDETSEMTDDLGDDSPVVIMPSKSFALNKGVSLLGPIDMQQRFGVMDHAMNMELSVRSVAAIDELMKRQGSRFDLITQVAVYSVKEYMFINADALSALQVFQGEAHPNMHNLKTKEGVSLFSMHCMSYTLFIVDIMNKTKSVSGARMLRSWMQRPLCSIEKIHQRQRLVEHFVKPTNRTTIATFQKMLKGVSPIDGYLMRIMHANKANDLRAIAEFAYCTSKIVESCKSVSVKFDRIDEISERDLYVLGETIHSVVDFEISFRENRFVAKPRVNERLDELRRCYDGLSMRMSDVAIELSGELDCKGIAALNVVYFPHVGFLLATPRLQDLTSGDFCSRNQSELQFHTENSSYFKCAKMRELDESYGDIHGEIVDLEVEIQHELRTILGGQIGLLRLTAEFCAQLDCIISLACAAIEYRLTKPELTDDSRVLRIIKGRHLIQEQYVEQFIANDVEFDDSDDDKRVMVVTGPNSSGKSVYMKMVGLTCILAQIGSFIPAEEGSVIGLVDRICTRIATRESCSRNESIFAIDLKQIRECLSRGRPRSLILLDEFGKGTASDDGISLLAAVLETFAQGTPRVIAVTHFTEIFEHSLVDSNRFLLKRMQAIPKASYKNAPISYTYRVIDGISESSFGIECARNAGIREDVAARAGSILEWLRGRKPLEELAMSEIEQNTFDRAERIINALMKPSLDLPFLKRTINRQ